jgi:cellulose synthase/poly-beta-1,6-N-acetylglucosamine synthase-like glycosyltransferase
MGMLIGWVLIAVAGVVAAAVAVFCIEVVAATVLPQRRVRVLFSGPRPPTAVLVPAHNEGANLLLTLADIRGQLRAGDRLLVVADNCDDDTAAVAAAGGAEVIERHDPERRGKGHALEFGIRHLASDPPGVVIVVDADCRLARDAIDQLVAACGATGRPVQALYLMTAPSGSQINHQVAQFAWRVRNWLRPLGLDALGLPCQMMGTGMALPWAVIGSANLGNGCIVEDLVLGLDLALAGHPPLFWPAARVTSEFASSLAGVGSQRKRWEQGHIQTILETAPRLLGGALVRLDGHLLAQSLDLAVPPLSLLGLLVVASAAVSGTAALLGVSHIPLAISGASLLAFAAALAMAWLKCGRDVLPPGALLLLAPYLAGKLRLYCRLLLGGAESQWVRTDRGKLR